MDHTFTNFIVGPSNRLAYQAAVAVANNPAASYNPLLIRAADGLGKTHLLHAIGHYLSHHRPAWQIAHLTPGSLSHKLHNAIQNRHVETLRNHYQKTDVLLVDDIQDIAGKRHTQQTLLHILDDLSNSAKQIVITSTIAPQDITPLDPRLRSRLSCGVVVEIHPPELETRLAILNQKAAAYHISLSDSVASRLASDSQTSLQELENNLARLVAYASLHDRRIDDELADNVMRQAHATSQQRVSIIQQTVASHFGVRVSDIKTRQRDRAILIPRQIAMYLCQELTNVSLSQIGQLFGNRSAATVHYACRKVDRLMDHNAGLTRAVQSLRETLAYMGVETADISFPQGQVSQACG